jgi:predicted HAD superfamily Cof-like phosphohydrolase/DNA-binding transcriptional regulator YiaG
VDDEWPFSPSKSELQEMKPATLGDCLRRMREIRGLTMGEVSRALDVGVAQISDWEIDRDTMTDEQQKLYLLAILKAYPTPREQELLEKNTELVTELRRVDHQRQVREFHTVVVGSALPNYPAVPPKPILDRQLRLITEEYLELMEAVYGEGSLRLALARQQLHAVIELETPNVNFIELMDASADLEYVNIGLNLWCGVDGNGVFSVVHESNMAKAGGPKRASDGKQLKPASWKPPDIAAEIERQKEAALARQRGPK